MVFCHGKPKEESDLIAEKMQDALNDQINAELYSEYIYLSMATYFHDENMDGMAQWMKAQAAEERAHAMKIFDHIIERGGRVKLKAIKEPPIEWDSCLAAWRAAYEHEMYITGRINSLVDLASQEDDKPTWAMLQWFVTEQVEEEEQTSKVVHLLEKIGDSSNGLAMLDRQLASRE
jgi:ferritin